MEFLLHEEADWTEDQEFIEMFTKIKFSGGAKTWVDHFWYEGCCKKKLRNDYDNRFKPKNIVLYYYYFQNKKLKKMNYNQKKIIKYHEKELSKLR